MINKSRTKATNPLFGLMPLLYGVAWMLMLKVFKNGRIKLYSGDCLNYMPSMPDKSVDAVITDPPYGIDFKYSTHDDSHNDYEVLMKLVIRQTERINNGMSFFWQAMKNADKWHCWFPPGYRIFAACKGFVQYRPTPIQYSFDPVIFWGDFNGKPSVYKKDFHVQSKAPFGFKRDKIEHPCPRPLEQVAYVINISTNPNDIVFDPFMGSGTTAIACLRLGREFVGCEIDPQYFSIAENRIKFELSRPSLFDQVTHEESNQLDLAI